jgi:hypothetical protein
MSKIRKTISWKIISTLTALSVLMMTIRLIPITQAASLTDASDTISDSGPGSTSVTHTFDFTINQDIPANGDILITFPNGTSIFDLSNVLASTEVTCPGGGNATVNVPNGTVECSTTTAQTATSALQIIVLDVDTTSTKTNATGVADAYTITIQTRDAGNAEIENAQVRVAIIEKVTMTASVASTLQFKISGLSSGLVINQATTTINTTTTTIPYGTVDAGSANAKVGGQEMRVTTNSNYGFVVTVQQDHNLLSAAGSDIDSFKDGSGTASTTPEVWAPPSGTLGTERTYGHMGFTSNDSNLSSDNGSYPDFSGAKFGGFNGSSTYVIFAHTGSSDGSTQNVGLARIAYKLELTSLQESGDYTNTLMYICTPTY